MLTSVECTAPVNIAVVKYWGKRDEKLVLPLNDSVSVTLSQQQLCARTKVTMISCDADQKSDCGDQFVHFDFWLNGEKQPNSLKHSKRLHNCLSELRKIATENVDVEKHERLLPTNHRLIIESHNNFPTAAGLASSAAGFACVTAAVARLYGVAAGADLSRVARLGSGSACRSMLGGFVHWQAGCRDDGSDSVAVQVATADHWPELRCLLVVVSDQCKDTASTAGMSRTVATSQLMSHRLQQHVVGARVEDMCRAIVGRDFATFAELTMRDSNQMHAVCQDTYPPIRYMTDVSHAIIRLVHTYNDTCHETGVCYTFDAGANACIYLLQSHVAAFTECLRRAFPPVVQDGADWLRGAPVEPSGGDFSKLQSVVDSAMYGRCCPNTVKYIIHTGVGEGPQIVSEQ